jgi:hypothetical protein
MIVKFAAQKMIYNVESMVNLILKHVDVPVMVVGLDFNAIHVN